MNAPGIGYGGRNWLRLFEANVYGRTPRNRLSPVVDSLSPDTAVFDGKATRRQVRIWFADGKDAKKGPKMDLLLYVPTGVKKPVPAFLGLNFTGNQAVHADEGIHLGQIWVKGVAQEATEKSRGSGTQQWQAEKLISRGYALATVYYGDIEPDFDGGMQYGVRSLFAEPGAGDWGALGAWAFGLSRALDYLDADPDVDAHRVAMMGHSRLGKAAVWAGAQDQRFSMVISNCSGTGGVSLFHRNYGETIEHLNVAFPHWFCRNFRQYSGHADKLPVDQHELIALSAPRPFYIGTAVDDQGADPHGGFLAAKAATPVYEMFGKTGITAAEMPPVNQAIMNDIGFHIRSGKHDVTAFDWDQYIAFADKHFGRRS